MSQTLVIVGMHRSGTSVVANWLNRCGLQLGERLLEPSPSNIDGHFEDLEFVNMHAEILASKNLADSGLVDAHHINLSVYQYEKLKSVLKVKSELYDQWAWKDPRTCLFLDTYRQLLPQSKYIIVVRDYQSVVNSLLNRDFSAIDQRQMNRSFVKRTIWKLYKRECTKRCFFINNAERYLKVWLAYNEEILKAVKQLPVEDFLIVNYETLRSEDRSAFVRLTSKWKFALDYVSFNDIYKPRLMTTAKNIEAYIQNKSLLTKADYIAYRLAQRMESV